MSDPRDLFNGLEIPSQGYCDQPFIIQTDDTCWLCMITTGSGTEGESGQHIISMRSKDQGRTWLSPVDVEPANGPEASYAVLLKIPGGRIYCFYNYNTDNLREVIAESPPYKDGKCRRVDSVGDYVFKYSDDNGQSWSAQRFTIPIREFDIDRENCYGGQFRFGWNVGKPFISNHAVYVSFHKAGGFGEGFFTRSEGVFLKSENLLSEPDPAKIRWITLPEGTTGLKAPKDNGPIAEEHSTVTLSDGSFYSVYRTIAGYPAYSISQNEGRRWSEPKFLRYADNRLIKNPRAANFVWKCKNGKFLYWFHNNSWTGYNNGEGAGSRNVAWLAGGIERNGEILWSQPEIIFYAADCFQGPSYPDLIEENGKYFISETQKTTARIHTLDTPLVEGLWGQFEAPEMSTRGLLLELPEINCGSAADRLPLEMKMPNLPEFTTRNYYTAGVGLHKLNGSFTIEVELQFNALHAGQTVLNSRDKSGKGFALTTTQHGTVGLILNDGRCECRWDCDTDMLKAGQRHHLVIIVDSAPNIITFIIDGQLCDGGLKREYGWGRFNSALRNVNGSEILRIGQNLDGVIRQLKIYNRYLKTSEAVAHCRLSVQTIANCFA